jgi:hypothetical protein
MTLTQILTILAVIGGLLLLVYLTRPKLSRQEQYLIKVIQAQSPQLDNIRLMMFIRTAVHPINNVQDLEYQEKYLQEVMLYRELCEQFTTFGPAALTPLLGYEAVTWQLDDEMENSLIVRLAANQVYHHYPRSLDILNTLVANAPDPVTIGYLKHDKTAARSVEDIRRRYRTNLAAILRVLISTPRNEWWPGTNPDLREWAEATLDKFEGDKDSQIK